MCAFMCEARVKESGKYEERGRDEVSDIIWLLGGVTNKSNC
jgi:hypothetical protein